MSTITLINYDSREIGDLQQCEKITRSERAIMPVHQSQSANCGSRRTPSSRSTSRRISRSKSGIHHRRRRMS
jgi:hypothetical protein